MVRFPPDNHATASDDIMSTATPATAPAPLIDHHSVGAGADGDANITAIADHVRYTLTVGQALDRFTASHRRLPSERSIQRYCIEGRIAAQKIRTTYGSEWLINERSLDAFIRQQPVVIGDDGDAKQPATAAPPLSRPASDGTASAVGDATHVVAVTNTNEINEKTSSQATRGRV